METGGRKGGGGMARHARSQLQHFSEIYLLGRMVLVVVELEATECAELAAELVGGADLG